MDLRPTPGRSASLEFSGPDMERTPKAPHVKEAFSPFCQLPRDSLFRCRRYCREDLARPESLLGSGTPLSKHPTHFLRGERRLCFDGVYSFIEGRQCFFTEFDFRIRV